MLHLIERATRQPIEQMDLPTIADVNATRVAKFKQRVAAALEQGFPDIYRGVVEELAHETGAAMTEVAAALATLAQGKAPLLLSDRPERHESRTPEGKATRDSARERDAAEEAPRRPRSGRFAPQDTYRLEVGRLHGVQAGNIVGAIANEAGLDGSEINGIKVREDHTLVRLPTGMPPEILKRLAGVQVRGRPLSITLLEQHSAAPKRKRP
jgi:ATP-dependent RNA helicase DeaD